MHHAIKEVTVSHEGLNYLQDRQETINDTALLLVTRSLFDLFHYVLKTNTTFCRMSQHSLQLHMCTAAMSFSIPFADLLGRHFSGLFVAALLPSASDKVSSWSEESRYTERQDTAIFQRVEGIVCVCALSCVCTSKGERRDMFISTHRQRKEELLVKWQVKGTEWGRTIGCLTRRRGTRCWVSGGSDV